MATVFFQGEWRLFSFPYFVPLLDKLNLGTFYLLAFLPLLDSSPETEGEIFCGRGDAAWFLNCLLGQLAGVCAICGFNFRFCGFHISGPGHIPEENVYHFGPAFSSGFRPNYPILALFLKVFWLVGFRPLAIDTYYITCYHKNRTKK